ncbi:hypothetical protein [Candidatus Manganitrophus noduliformans]|uniref:TIGR04255 family protein n=1 Tax=Candidatus Manganitrophus noduliformans TaxID=2606439 RepID=A0A7X6ICU7_9BACT|nr:hypothetical protein [Candidatus Manganitrophus noduliformans]NKE72921.1 hypothetical protein [Candidatus Manganitrophus noduliformans]
MAEPEIIYQEGSIVLVGSFNPEIFHPSWFAKNDLIQKVEAEESKIEGLEIVHRELTKFSLNWLSIQVVHQKFVALTSDVAHFNPLRDLVIMTFEILKHTPVKQLGMNRIVDFSFEDEQAWHKVGDTLAPKGIWEKSLSGRVGLTALGVQSKLTNGLQGYTNVNLQPSARTKHGVTININNHVEIADGQNIAAILSEHWVTSMDKAIKIAQTTLREVLT